MQEIDFTFDAEFFEDPYPAYRMHREKNPVALDRNTGMWMAFSHDAVRQALDDHAHFSSSKGNAIVDAPERVGRTLGSMDPPQHDQLKPIIQKGFTVSKIATSVEQLLTEAKPYIERLQPGAQLDFVGDLSRPLLYGALGRMLGLTQEASADAANILNNLFDAGFGPTGGVLLPEDMQNLFALFTEQLAYRRSNPSDDLFSTLIAAQADNPELKDEFIIANMTTVLLAGNASIGHFFPNLINALYLHPGEHKKVREDLSLIPALIEESVRWDTSTHSFARHVPNAVELAGVPVPADARIVLFYASANRDDHRIPDADTFDIGRKRAHHFGFGAGVHYCMGAMTARRFLTPLLEQLIPALGEFELDIDSATRVEHAMVRGFRSLPMTVH